MSQVEILQQNGYNFLWIDGYLWMWDLPFEVEIQEDIASEAFGDVLVVGLGLGIVQKYLAKNKAVKNIDTVEKYLEVHTEYFACFNKAVPGRIIFDDFYYLPEISYQQWDCVIGDLWPEISNKYLDEYIKFKNHAQTLLREGGKILGWGVEYYEYLLEKQEIVI